MKLFLQFMFCLCILVYPYFCAELVATPDDIAYKICAAVCRIVIAISIYMFTDGDEP